MADTALITIRREEYEDMQKAIASMYDWIESWVKCPLCGYYHPQGNICIRCAERAQNQ